MSTLFCLRRGWLKAAAIALLLLSTSVQAAPPGLMLSYELTHDMLRTTDNFSVSIYEDGVALVHYPEYMDKAGDYAVELSPSEVQEIRLLLEHPLVQGFEPGQAKARKKAIDDQLPEAFAISDDSYSNFELHSTGTEKRIRWANLAVDAERYPEIGVFRKLADVEADLLQLDQHPTARAVQD